MGQADISITFQIHIHVLLGNRVKHLQMFCKPASKIHVPNPVLTESTSTINKVEDLEFRRSYFSKFLA